MHAVVSPFQKDPILIDKKTDFIDVESLSNFASQPTQDSNGRSLVIIRTFFFIRKILGTSVEFPYNAIFSIGVKTFKI